MATSVTTAVALQLRRGFSSSTTSAGSVSRIDFFYDVASPYSWLAFETLMRYKTIWDVEIKLRPFFLGGVMKATGNKPPATNEVKGRYMGKDLKRMAQYHGVQLVPLKDVSVMYDTISAQRLLTAASVDQPACLEGLTRELWKRIWRGGGEIVTEKGLGEACARAGLQSEIAASLLSRIGDADVKERLKETTEDALSRGAFGAPWITVQRGDRPWEAFFGCDRFEMIASELGQPWHGAHPLASKL